MKKDRNSFFSQYGVSAYNANQPFMYPNQMNSSMSSMSSMNMGQPPMGAPMPQQYQAAMPQQQMMNTPVYNEMNDLDARLNKIERELQRIDARLNKLEATSPSASISNNDYNFANSMYMV